MVGRAFILSSTVLGIQSSTMDKSCKTKRSEEKKILKEVHNVVGNLGLLSINLLSIFKHSDRLEIISDFINAMEETYSDPPQGAT